MPIHPPYPKFQSQHRTPDSEEHTTLVEHTDQPRSHEPHPVQGEQTPTKTHDSLQADDSDGLIKDNDIRLTFTLEHQLGKKSVLDEVYHDLDLECDPEMYYRSQNLQLLPRSPSPKARKLASWKPLKGVDVGLGGEYQSVAFTPDGKHMAASFNGRLKLWSMGNEPSSLQSQTPRTMKRFSGQGWFTIAPDSSWILWWHKDTLTRSEIESGRTLWARRTDMYITREARQLLQNSIEPSFQKYYRSAKISPDGNIIAADLLETLELRNAKDGLLIYDISHPPGSIYHAFSPDGGLMEIGRSYSKVQLWDVEAKTLKWRVTDVGLLKELLFSADGKWIAVSMGIYKTDILRIEDGEACHTVTTPSWVLGSLLISQPWAFSLNGQLFANSQNGDGFLFRDAVTLTEDYTLNSIAKGHITDIAISANSMLLASGTDEGEIALWDLTTGTKIMEYVTDSRLYISTKRLQFHPGGHYLLAEHINSGSVDPDKRHDRIHTLFSCEER